MEIKVNDIVKKIRGQLILDHISYRFSGGHIYGLTGINGSGKTMFLRALAGLIHLNSGEIRFDDQVLHRDMDFAPNTGIIIENMRLLPQFNAFDNLKQLGKIHGTATTADIRWALEAVGMNKQIETPKLKDYSLGMRQKLNIAQAIFEHQQVILLDEPTNGLDTESVKICIQILQDLREQGCLIILASHISDDMSQLADVRLTLDAGKLVQND